MYDGINTLQRLRQSASRGRVEEAVTGARRVACALGMVAGRFRLRGDVVAQDSPGADDEDV